jgi:hypothetical protein
MHANHVLAQGLKAAKNGPPVKEGKSAFVAFLAGFLFGPFGCGVYLESFQDFFVPLVLVLGASFMTGGVAAPVAWMFCGAYAAMRVNSSEGESTT